MARIRLNLRRLSVTEKLAKGRQIVNRDDEQREFCESDPTAVGYSDIFDELEKAFQQPLVFRVPQPPPVLKGG